MPQRNYTFDPDPEDVKPRLFDRAGMRPSANVEVRDPNDPKEKADVQRMLDDLRGKRTLMKAMLNEPQNIFQREDMEKWLNNRRNDPDYNEKWDAGGRVQISDPIGQQIVKADAAEPGQPVKPMPEMTDGTGMDRAQPRTTTVSLVKPKTPVPAHLEDFMSQFMHGDSEYPL